MRIPIGRRGMLLTIAGLAVLTLIPGQAHGFFWPGWPGSGIKSKQPLVTTPPGGPLSPPGNFLPPEEEEPPIQPDVPGIDIPPPAIPEPATIVGTMLGLSCVGMWNRRRRGNKVTTPEINE